jgi:hypothetical protein
MPDSCYNDSVNTTRGHWLYVAADCNGDCNQSGADITRLVAYFKGTAHLTNCRFFPTTLPPLIRTRHVDVWRDQFYSPFIVPSVSVKQTAPKFIE